MIGLGVAYFSGPQGGAGKFMQFLEGVLHLSPQSAELVNFVVRKGIHLTAYGLLAQSAARLAAAQSGLDRPALVSALPGLSWALVHAVYDETYQSSVPGRTGTPWDVLLDLAGMSLFVFPLVLRKQPVAQ